MYVYLKSIAGRVTIDGVVYRNGTIARFKQGELPSAVVRAKQSGVLGIVTESEWDKAIDKKDFTPESVKDGVGIKKGNDKKESKQNDSNVEKEII